MGRPERVLLVLILLAAFGVRVLGLGVQDLSDDEVFFVHIAHDATYLQLAGSDEPHPPLYLALLQGWMVPAGVTEYGVRFLSVVFGVATVAAAYLLGRQIAGRRLGVGTALAAALNPYHIFYSQTARNYQMACLFALLSLVLLLWALRQPRMLPAYALSALLAMYSHYYAIAIVLLEQVILVGWLWRRHWIGLRSWVAADAVAGIAFLPWLAYSLRTLANYEPGHGTPDIVGSALLQTFQYYNFGTAFRPQEFLWPSVAAAALLALGFVRLAEAGGRRALGLSLGYQAAPLLFGLATLLHTTQFGARFLFLGSPGYLLIVGGAIALLAGRWFTAWIGIAALGSMAGFAIHNSVFTDQYTDKAYSRLAAYLALHISPTESVVLDGISQSLQYWYYGQLRNNIGQRVAIMPLKADGGGADGSPVDLGQTQRGLDQIMAGSSGVWLIDDDSLRYDPNLDTQRILALRAFRAFSVGFKGQRLDYYGLGQAGPPAELSATLDGVTLVQSSRVQGAVPAGRAVPLELTWTASRDDPAPFKESVRLLDSSGAVISQDDGLPGAGFWERSWRSGAAREDRRGLLIPVGTMPGTYKLQLVAYDAASGRALGQAIDLQPVQVDHSVTQRPEAADLPAADVALGGERLVGFRASPEVAAGEKLNLSLLWSGNRAPDAASVSLDFGNVSIVHQIGGGAYDTTKWQPFDVVREELAMRVPAGMPPGVYPVMAENVMLARVRVLPTRRVFAAPPVGHPSGARFGDVAELLGYDAEPGSGGVHVRLVWKALTETPISYTVFVHAVGDDGRILAQADRPAGTNNWDAGEYVTTDYTLAASGDYSLLVGMYDARSGVRLPACSGASGCNGPSDSVVLPRSS